VVCYLCGYWSRNRTSKGKAFSRHPAWISSRSHRLATGCGRPQYGTEVLRMRGKCSAGRSEVQELWKHYWLKGDQLLRSSTIARFTHIGAQDEPVVLDEPQSDIHLTSPTAFARLRDNRSHAASEGWGGGSDLAVNGQVLPEVLPEVLPDCRDPWKTRHQVGFGEPWTTAHRMAIVCCPQGTGRLGVKRSQVQILSSRLWQVVG
jgi:hypothetical protein